MSIDRKRMVRMAAITVLGSIAIVLTALEWTVRTFFPQPLGISYRSEMALPVHTPDHTMHRKTEEFEMTTTFNSLGLRDREIQVPKPEDVYRILVLGDSITAALEVDDEEVYTEILEASLNTPPSTTRFEVVNAGVSGFGQGDQLRMLKHLGEKVRPDWVLVQMSPINDLSENLFCRWYRVEQGKVVTLAEIPPGLAVRFEEWLGRHSQLAQWVRVRLHQMFGGRAEHFQRIETHKRIYHDFIYGAGGSEQDFEEDWKTTFAYLDALHVRSGELGAGFGVMIRPLDPDAAGTRNDPYPTNLILEYCRNNGIPCLDLTPTFRERANGDIHKFRFVDDSHWRPEGHRWAGEALLSFLGPEVGIPTHGDLVAQDR